MMSLYRWAKGWGYRGTPGNGTIFSSHPDYTDLGSVEQVVDAELAEDTDDETAVAIALGFVPRNGDDAMYDNVNLGDAIDVADIDRTLQTYRTRTLKVKSDRFGVPTFGLEANSKIEDDLARQQRFLSQSSPGSLSGRSDSVSSADLGAGISWGKLPKAELGTYSENAPDSTSGLYAEVDWTDDTDVGHSPWWPVDEPILIYRVIWSLKVASDADTLILIRLKTGNPFDIGGVPFFHSFTIPAGTTSSDDDTDISTGTVSGHYTNQVANKGDFVRAATYSTGAGGDGLEVRVKYTSQT